MAVVELIMPKMGESIMEATILKWLKNPGETVEMDESILEIATDKVDSEVPCPVDGVLSEVLFKEGDVVPIGTVIARLSTEGEVVASPATNGESSKDKAPESTPTPEPIASEPTPQPESTPEPEPVSQPAQATAQSVTKEPEVLHTISSAQGRFYSPLVKRIAQEEGIDQDELDRIVGSGAGGRVTKRDILNHLETRGTNTVQPSTSISNVQSTPPEIMVPKYDHGDNVEIVEMDRMRKMIADHMVMSKRVSPHVTSFVEADVTNVVKFRQKQKGPFQDLIGEKLTYTPFFIEAVAQALVDFPGVNASVDGTNIILKKDINVGMAAALPNGNLIVPVIRNADKLNLVQLTKQVNELSLKAREGKLAPDDIQGGTFTLTNVGTFGNLSGTPIINQPQVAILSVGAIRKKPAVMETAYGDVITVRHMMMMSLSFDHRVVDGFLGGSYLRKVADILEGLEMNRKIL